MINDKYSYLCIITGNKIVFGVLLIVCITQIRVRGFEIFNDNYIIVSNVFFFIIIQFHFDFNSISKLFQIQMYYNIVFVITRTTIITVRCYEPMTYLCI